MIACQLQPNKLIEGQILVECLDNEIPVVMSAGSITVKFIASTFSIPNGIKPVTCPSFAIAIAGKESIDQFFVCVRGRIFDKGVDFLRSGRKTKQIEIGTAN